MDQDQGPSMSSWPGQPMPDETMASHDRPDDFTDLLDFDFDFSTLDNNNNDNNNDNDAMPAASSSAQMQTSMMQDMQLTCLDPIQTTQPSPYAQMQSMDVQQQSMAPPGYGHQAFIPPTPNSMEMHGRAHNYPMQIETETRRIYEPYTRGVDDQSAFTPLMSPAMTPLEQQYRLPEYIPGECFTPLTSPALEGRNPNTNNFLFNNPSQQLDMNFVSSPMEFPNHMASAPASSSSPGAIRKHRRKMSLQSRAGTRLVRQSPCMRPSNSQQRQQIPSGSTEEHSQANTPAGRSSLFVQLSSDESSGQDSASLEPLAEPLMPPPALPRANGNGKSPRIAMQESKQAPQSTQAAIAPAQSATPAATPATLMRLQNQQHDPSQTPFSRSGSVLVDDATDEVMEDISLPEPASGPLQSSTPNERTPSLTPRQTPAPTSARPGSSSTGPSPQIGAMSSPAGPVGSKRADSRQRNTKKRQSTNTHSAQISPALRPKMSPSLKPLIKGPSDNMSADTSALYLASKSNYQHILEGTVLPGVSYPDSLAENLSSKRTNHKLAEQGRRNRINTALKEIEGLLPPSLAEAQTKETGDTSTNGANGASKSPDKPSSSQPISKASTVEMAIVYIKSLREDLEETKGRLKVAEDKLGEKNGVQQQQPASPSESDKQASAAETTVTKRSDAAQSPEAVSMNSDPAKATG